MRWIRTLLRTTDEARKCLANWTKVSKEEDGGGSNVEQHMLRMRIASDLSLASVIVID